MFIKFYNNNYYELICGNYQKLSSVNNNIEVYIKGVILNSQYIYDYFETLNYSLLNKLNGSFNLIVIDKSNNDSVKVTCITDVVNSLKLFYKKFNDGVEISDDLDDLVDTDSNLNIKGVACYLANGNMLNEMTVFQGINIIEPASCYVFDANQLLKNKYWHIEYNYADDYNVESLEDKLSDLLESSIKDRLAQVKGNDVLVSLSAGYDARTIFGALKKQNSSKRIETFTYRPTTRVIKNSDAHLSEKISHSFNATHYGFKSYDGNFLSLLKKNAIKGKCVAHFCDELDAIQRVKNAKVFSALFVGDEWFGRLDVPLNTKQEMLDSVSISGSWGVKWLKEHLKENSYLKIKKELDILTDEIYRDSDKFYNKHDQKDYLYLRQRVNHVNLIWREYFSSDISFTHNPFLDRRILDFFKSIHPNLRIEKRLFIRTVKRKYKELFEIPIAHERTSLAGISYKSELIKHREEIIQYINSTNSLLTEFISKGELLNCLVNVTKKETFFYKINRYFSRGINALRRLNKQFDFIVTPLLGPRTVKVPSKEKLVLRLLVLYIYLENNKSK